MGGLHLPPYKKTTSTTSTNLHVGPTCCAAKVSVLFLHAVAVRPYKNGLLTILVASSQPCDVADKRALLTLMSR